MNESPDIIDWEIWESIDGDDRFEIPADHPQKYEITVDGSGRRMLHVYTFQASRNYLAERDQVENEIKQLKSEIGEMAKKIVSDLEAATEMLRARRRKREGHDDR